MKPQKTIVLVKTKPPTFTQKHYQAIADCLKNVEGKGPAVAALMDMFKEDNPKFNAGKFLAAVTPKKGEAP